ncbi:hypothetical protein [Methylosinus sp. Ce-a6]|uniref:hypothetical protein n=1 Tax=Methylosinus sp. Ce-a6 TaxID=2172005 RepID=UPI00135A323B|nr:hypothetical protein [Methylosinus sp. Ce-a6]
MFRSQIAEPRARALLVCIADRRPPREPRRARPPGALELSGATLLRRWETTGLPFVFVERDLALQRTASDAAAAGPPRFAGEAVHAARRPTADGFLLRAERPSLLRDPSFVRLFERLGGPLLILLGDELGDLAVETAVDGFLAGHPIIVVKDAWPFPLDDETEVSAARAAALPLLSCFARLMGASELARDWTGAD